MKRHCFVLGLALLVGLAAGCPRPKPPAWLGQVPDADAVGLYHEVQPGQNLLVICRAYGADPQEVAEVNGIQDPDRIQAGQRIFIPDVQKPVDVAAGQPPTEPQAATSGHGKPSAGRFIWPLDGVLTSRFGIRSGRRHDGIDIGAPTGTTVRAAADADVLFVGEQGGYGKLVILQHAGQWITVYAHTHRNLVKEGQRVRQGQPIAEVGQTGRTTGPHLHFEIREATKPRNPLFYLPRPN